MQVSCSRCCVSKGTKARRKTAQRICTTHTESVGNDEKYVSVSFFNFIFSSSFQFTVFTAYFFTHIQKQQQFHMQTNFAIRFGVLQYLCMLFIVRLRVRVVWRQMTNRNVSAQANKLFPKLIVKLGLFFVLHSNLNKGIISYQNIYGMIHIIRCRDKNHLHCDASSRFFYLLLLFFLLSDIFSYRWKQIYFNECMNIIDEH